MDITLEQARAVVAPPAAAGGSAPAKEQMHTPEKATVSVAHPEEGSESQMEATDLEEAVEEGRDTLTAQRFKCAKATQHSPQKRKPKAVRILVATQQSLLTHCSRTLYLPSHRRAPRRSEDSMTPVPPHQVRSRRWMCSRRSFALARCVEPRRRDTRSSLFAGSPAERQARPERRL